MQGERDATEKVKLKGKWAANQMQEMAQDLSDMTWWGVRQHDVTEHVRSRMLAICFHFLTFFLCIPHLNLVTEHCSH